MLACGWHQRTGHEVTEVDRIPPLVSIYLFSKCAQHICFFFCIRCDILAKGWCKLKGNGIIKIKRQLPLGTMNALTKYQGTPIIRCSDILFAKSDMWPEGDLVKDHKVTELEWAQRTSPTMLESLRLTRNYVHLNASQLHCMGQRLYGVLCCNVKHGKCVPHFPLCSHHPLSSVAREAYRIKFNDCEKNNINNDVHQGGILSPVLFTVYMDDLSKQRNRCNTGCFV